MKRIISLSLAALFGILGSGCSTMVPHYTAPVPNVEKLKNAGEYTAKVGTFDSDKNPANANPISLRGSSLVSPYNDSYASYLGEAIKQELTLAGKLNASAEVEISGVLLKNDIDATGFSMAHGDIEARFVVQKAGKVRYDQVKSVRHEWESSFVGAIAIPRAQQEYTNLVQKLLAVLYEDQSFFQALK